MQSPTTTRAAASDSELVDSKFTRGVLTDAPRRDTTMTQDSDSGDAVGDAGPNNRLAIHCRGKVKIDLTGKFFHASRSKNCCHVSVRRLPMRKSALSATAGF